MTPEADIRTTYDENQKEVTIDMVVHLMKTDEHDPDLMNVSYAACKSVIQNATKQRQE